MKLLILKVLNQKIKRVIEVEDPTPLLYSLLERDLGKSKFQSQTFTFMIDETDPDKKPKPVEVQKTVYQEIKQYNFKTNDQSSKKIHIKIID